MSVLFDVDIMVRGLMGPWILGIVVAIFTGSAPFTLARASDLLEMPTQLECAGWLTASANLHRVEESDFVPIRTPRELEALEIPAIPESTYRFFEALTQHSASGKKPPLLQENLYYLEGDSTAEIENFMKPWIGAAWAIDTVYGNTATAVSGHREKAISGVGKTVGFLVGTWAAIILQRSVVAKFGENHPLAPLATGLALLALLPPSLTFFSAIQHARAAGRLWQDYYDTKNFRTERLASIYSSSTFAGHLASEFSKGNYGSWSLTTVRKDINFQTFRHGELHVTYGYKTTDWGARPFLLFGTSFVCERHNR